MVFLDSEFGPATWTMAQWVGVGCEVGAFFVLVALVWRLAAPATPRRTQASREEKASDGR